jgi:hypothetical protein
MTPKERNRRVLQFLAVRTRPVTAEAIAHEMHYLTLDQVRRAVESMGGTAGRGHVRGNCREGYQITMNGRAHLDDLGLPDTTLSDGRDAQRAAVVEMMLGRAEA